MSTIVLKTAKRKTSVSRMEVRRAVAATFEAGTLALKNAVVKKNIKRAATKSAA
ncbi:MAG: hypothetical protein IPP72_18475 [Chitinophagaceae bacterium]|nr:hypothetical protein [Chitinophagaceae bacterium]